MFRTIRLTLVLSALLLVCTAVALAYTSRQKSDLHWINSVRAQHHASSIHLGRAMTKRAQKWANYLASKNRAEADDTAGSNVCFKSGGVHYGANSAIAGGYKNDLARDQTDLKNSPPHLANIVYRHFQWVGVGIARDSHGLILIQDFCGK